MLATRGKPAQAHAFWMIMTKASARAWAVIMLSPVSDHPKKAEQQRRERRLSAALRENLKRRKAQAKARTAANPAVSGAEHDDQPHDSAGIAADKRRVE